MTDTLKKNEIFQIIKNTTYFRCGVIQEGDRVVGVNDIEITNQSAEQVNQLIRDHRHRCDLNIEYDVAGQDQASIFSEHQL